MSLPWVRLDTSIGDHPKFLALIADRKHRAGLAYILGLAYCGRHELDGFIPSGCLTQLHATKADAAALVEVGLWQEDVGGWRVNGWSDFQISGDESRKRREKAQQDSARMNCVRWHGSSCGCWKDAK